MITTTPAHEPDSSAPRGRLRKRWIVLAAICTCMSLTIWYFIREVPVAVMRLSNGQRFIIHKLTYGFQHSYRDQSASLTSGEIWLNRQLARVGRQIVPTGGFGGIYGQSTPSVGLWVSFDWAQQTVETMPACIVMTDRHGWRTVINTAYMQIMQPTPVPGQPYTPPCLFAPLPLPLSPLQFELLNATGKRLAQTKIPYDVPQTLQQARAVSQLPATETVDKLSVTLNALRAEWAKSPQIVRFLDDSQVVAPVAGDTLTIVPEYIVKNGDVESADWIPLIDGVPLMEMFGSTNAAGAQMESSLGVFSPLSYCTLSPYDSSWRLYLPLICTNPDNVSPADRADLGRLSFLDGKPASVDSNEPVSIGTAKVKILGIGRAGYYEYHGLGEAALPTPASMPLEAFTANHLKGKFQSNYQNPNQGFGSIYFTSATPTLSKVASPVAGATIVSTVLPTPGGQSGSTFQVVRQPRIPMNVDLDFTAQRPHIAISVSEAGDKYPCVIVKDETGRSLEGDLFNVNGIVIWQAKQYYEDVQHVNVTLLLQTPRNFAFTVSPPTVPPRPTEITQ